MLEMDKQCSVLGLKPARMISATGSGSIQDPVSTINTLLLIHHKPSFSASYPLSR